jgi:hypothetical protein
MRPRSQAKLRTGEGYQAFISATTLLYNDLKALAEATGKADIATLLNDLKQDLVPGVTTLAPTGGNTGLRLRPSPAKRLDR